VPVWCMRMALFVQVQTPTLCVTEPSIEMAQYMPPYIQPLWVATKGDTWILTTRPNTTKQQDIAHLVLVILLI